MDDQPIFFIQFPGSLGNALFWDIKANYPAREMYPHVGPAGPDVDGFTARTDVDYLLGLPADRISEIRIFTGFFPFAATELLGLDLLRITIVCDPVKRAAMHLADQLGFERNIGMSPAELYGSSRYRAQPNLQTRMFAMTPHDGLSTYLDPMSLDDARFDRACRNLDEVDVVGVEGRYDELLRELEARFGWVTGKAPAPIEDIPDSIDEELLDRMRADNEYDLRFYAYAQRLVGERVHAGTVEGASADC